MYAITCTSPYDDNTPTRKIRTRHENRFRSQRTLAAEDNWMLKGVLINADCSTVRWDMNSFIRLSNIRMPVPDAFIIMLPIHLRSLEQYNYIFLFGIPLISIFILCLYFASYYFWNAVNQHLTLYLLCQLLLSGILLISIVMIKICDDMTAAFRKPCGYTVRTPYIKRTTNYIASFSNTEGH